MVGCARAVGQPLRWKFHTKFVAFVDMAPELAALRRAIIGERFGGGVVSRV
jgi:hypothetical protein